MSKARSVRGAAARRWLRSGRDVGENGSLLPVVLYNTDDGWWDAPDRLDAFVMWTRPQWVWGPSTEREGSRYWLLHLREPVRPRDDPRRFEHVLAYRSRRTSGIGRNRTFDVAGVPVYPVLRRVYPGDIVLFGREVLPGVKAGIRRAQ